MASTTPNLGLRKWDAQSDLFSYTELANNWTLVDQHDHTTGKGVQIPTAGLANAAVTTPKIAATAVDTSKLADVSVTSAKVALNALSYTHMGVDATSPAAGCFNAYRSTNSSQATSTKVIYNAAEWDLGGWYSTTTGLFTPQVKGIYLLTGAVTFTVAQTDQDWLAIDIYKNNAQYRAGGRVNQSGVFNDLPGARVSSLVDANGTTDNFSITVFYSSGVTQTVLAGSTRSYFQGYLVAKRS